MKQATKPYPSRIVSEANLSLLRSDYIAAYSKLLKASSLLQSEKLQWQLAFEEMADIYNNAPCGYHSIDENGVFVHINDTELEWLGYNRDEVVDKMKFMDVLTPQSQLFFQEKFPQLIREGRIEDLEYFYARKDGTVFPVWISATAVYNERGKYKMSRSIIVNIAKQKQLENDLQQAHNQLLQSNLEMMKRNEELMQTNEKLFLLNHEKNKFIGIASHDLQHPLIGIEMLSETLLKQEELTREEIYDIIKSIHEASLQMKGLIGNYLSTLRMDAGQFKLNWQSTDLTRLTRSIVNRFEAIAQKKNISLFFKARKQYVQPCDKDCFSQIVENLLSNAIKYSYPGQCVFITLSGNAHSVIIDVQDEGVGIQKKELPLLFKRFQKLTSQPTGGEFSSGLGLSIVKYFIDQLQGTIKVNSTPGKGTRFTVKLSNTWDTVALSS